MQDEKDYELLEEGDSSPMEMSVIGVQESAFLDVQISTAKKYPRVLRKCLENCIVIATSGIEMAKTCRYSLVRGGKTVTGPTIHLAQILASNYKNLRVSSRIVRNDGKNIFSEGICFDLENNVAFKVEISRKITDKHGNPFSEDMQTMTGNAANAISMRNAIFKVVPRSFTNKILSEVEKYLDGELSDNASFLKERTKTLATLESKYAINEERALKAIGAHTIQDIDKEKLKVLMAILQSIEDGDSTPAEAFPMDTASKASAFSEKIKRTKGNNESTDDKQPN